MDDSEQIEIQLKEFVAALGDPATSATFLIKRHTPDNLRQIVHMLTGALILGEIAHSQDAPH